MKSEKHIIEYDGVGNPTDSSLFACRHTLSKQERIDSHKLIDELFSGGHSQSSAVFPVRVVYMVGEKGENDKAQAQMLVSVSKRHFKRAVKRNRVKRQVREAYRQNKRFVAEAVSKTGKRLYMAFIWQADRLYTSAEVEQSIKTLLQRVSERICR